MKILQVMAGGKHGGAETAFVDISIALHESGEHVEVVTRANNVRVPRLESAGIQVHIVPFGGKVDVYSHWRMRRIIKGFQPDIVQGWMSRGSHFIPRWTKSMKIPHYKTVARLGGYYKLKYFKSIDYFVAVTPDIKNYLVGEGIDKNRVTQISNFAEVEAMEQGVDRAALGVPEDASLLLALGRLHKCKGFDVLIKAVSKVPEVCLWIAGEGKERRNLEALIATLGLQDRVYLLGWRTDRGALFQAADVCVLPSRFEPFGTVFVQAWAQKIPLLTGNSDGPRQFVRDGEDGLIVSIDDVDAMADGIKRLIDDKALRESLVEAGFARYEVEFTKAQCVQNYFDYYHSIKTI